MAAVAFIAGVAGLGQAAESPVQLTYLTPPDASSVRIAGTIEEPIPSVQKSSPAPTAEPTQSSPAAYTTHEVQPGDTLSGIADQYGVDVQYLLWNNPELTTNPDLLIIGARLLVPGVNGIVYDVRLGDTVNNIAATYDVEPQEVVDFAANDLYSPDLITEGMVLVLPGAVPPPPPPPPEPEPEPAPEPAPPAQDPPAAASGPLPAAIAPTVPPVQQPTVTSVSHIWPVSGTLWGGFGPRWGSFHKGVDIGASYGTSVTATAAGQVVLSTYSDNGYGNYVIVRHADGSETLYAHLSERYVTLGQSVGQGELLGAVGCTGWCTGNHLHFEVHIGGGPVDPMGYLP